MEGDGKDGLPKRRPMGPIETARQIKSMVAQQSCQPLSRLDFPLVLVDDGWDV